MTLSSTPTYTGTKVRKKIRPKHYSLRRKQGGLKAALRKTNIKKEATGHTSRRSFASHLPQSGAEIRTVQDLLGHSPREITTPYFYTYVLISEKGQKLLCWIHK